MSSMHPTDNKENILLTYTQYSTFVQADDFILSEGYRVQHQQFTPSKKPLRFIFELFRQFFQLLFTAHKYQVFYCWFADYHSLLPFIFGKLWGRKNIVIVGGYDAVAIPDLQFGIFLKHNLRAYFARKTYQLATFIVPVDKSLVEDTNYYADPTGTGYPIGVKHFVKNITAEFRVIPTGYDPEKWKPRAGIKRKKSVVTIGGGANLQTFRRKGLDFFLQVAAAMPDIEFEMVGLKGPMLKHAQSLAGKNVKLTGFVNNKEIPALLSGHQVFCQFSLSEGLPNTLCEAMLCECIPVGSSANGIPYGIGETGFVLQRPDLQTAVQLIQKALEAPVSQGQAARTRILELFLLAHRRKQINALIKPEHD